MAGCSQPYKNLFGTNRRGKSGSLRKEGSHLDSEESSSRRIVILGKTGSGKSSMANTIFGDDLFAIAHSANSGTRECQDKTRPVKKRNVTLIDTPGFLDTAVSEEKMKSEIVKCLTKCSPGPHAFLIVLKVERFTEQEEAVVSKICEYFSEEALKHAAVVFTHGDQLPEGMTIKQFVSENKKLSDLVQKCGGRCHVIDNKYWEKNNNRGDRNNRAQVKKLLSTIDKMVTKSSTGYYVNEMLEAVNQEIKKEEEHIRQTRRDLTEEQIKTQAIAAVCNRILIRLAGVGTGVVLGALLGLTEAVREVITGVASGEGLAGGLSTAARAAMGVVMAAASGIAGSMIGYNASDKAETPLQAAKSTADEVFKAAEEVNRRIKSTSSS